MMMFLLFAPASTKWLGWRKDRKFRRDRSGRFCDMIVQSYFDTLLRYVVTFCGAVVLKVMDQTTLVKRRWGYKIRLTVPKHLESLPDTSSQIVDLYYKPCQTLFLFLWTEEDSAPNKQDEWTTASLSLAERWTITEIRRQSRFCADLFPAHRCPSVIKFQIRLECSSVNRPNVLLISKAYFPANKMNWMWKVKEKKRKIQLLVKSFLTV